MPDDAKHKAARKAVKAAQRQFDRESATAQKARREAFAKAQKVGHNDPKVTLGIYAQVISSKDDHGAALDDLVGVIDQAGASPQERPSLAS